MKGSSSLAHKATARKKNSSFGSCVHAQTAFDAFIVEQTDDVFYLVLVVDARTTPDAGPESRFLVGGNATKE